MTVPSGLKMRFARIVLVQTVQSPKVEEEEIIMLFVAKDWDNYSSRKWLIYSIDSLGDRLAV